MCGCSFCGLVHRLLATWYWPIRRRSSVNEIVREPKWSRVAIDLTNRRWMCEKDCARIEMEQEQSKHDCARDRKRKRRDTDCIRREYKGKEKESDRLRKKRCIQRESSGCRQDKSLVLKLFRRLLCRLHCYTRPPAHTLHMLQWISICIFLDILLCASRHSYSVHSWSLFLFWRD